MAIDKIKISSSTAELFATFKSLYSISFPEFEQRTEVQQESALLQKNYHLIAYREETNFIGFIAYWEFDSYIYIEHFAITHTIRGKGYGFKILNDFIHSNAKIVLLEIDPIVDDISDARLRFYEKCGFLINSHKHIHPPYREGYQGHQLLILTTQREITSTEYEAFNTDLQSIVMNF